MEKIKITKEGYESLLKMIAEKEKKLSEINLGRNSAWGSGTKDGFDPPEMEYIRMVSRGIERELLDLRIKRDNCIIIERENKGENIVNIEDVIVVEIKFAEDDIEEDTIKIVADLDGFFGEDGISRVSIDSPLGKAVYGREIGKDYNYSVNGNNLVVRVKEKVKQSEEEALASNQKHSEEVPPSSQKQF